RCYVPIIVLYSNMGKHHVIQIIRVHMFYPNNMLPGIISSLNDIINHHVTPINKPSWQWIEAFTSLEHNLFSSPILFLLANCTYQSKERRWKLWQTHIMDEHMKKMLANVMNIPWKMIIYSCHILLKYLNYFLSSTI
ncbi:hypothetical protein ACJX0J_012227, partial [Zea mays]